MPSDESTPKFDRQAALSDFKNRLLDFADNGFLVPETDVYDEPVRYFKANKQWTPIIFGFLTWLEDLAAWKEADSDGFAGIQGILKFEEGIELVVSDFDCGDVEDCLESSTIINNIVTDITNITNEIEDLQDETDVGGVNLPPVPSSSDSGDNVCAASNYVANRVSGILLDTWTKARSYSLLDFVQLVLGEFLDFSKVVAFWQYAITIFNGGLGDSAVTYTDEIAQIVFCANGDLARIIDDLETTPHMPDAEQALWRAIFDNFTQAQIDEWMMIGTLDTTSYDCSSGCPWVAVWDFANLYTPSGDEDLIVHGIGSWSIVQGILVAGVGINNPSGTIEISHALPEQCRLISYTIHNAKGANCAAMDTRAWWRGVAGTATPAYSGAVRTLGSGYTNTTISVFNAIMDTMKVGISPFLCGGGLSTCVLGYVRMIGNGVVPIA